MDPRIERTRQAVHRACLAVLANRGFAGLTMESVAAAAGVAKSTIYRHWPTKIDLIAAALEELNRQPPDEARDTDTRGRVEQLLEHLARALRDSTISRCVPALIEAAERHPEVAEFLHAYSARRRQTLVDALQAGIDAGDLSPKVDPELAAIALSGPIIYRRTMTPSPFSPAHVPALVDLVIGPHLTRR